MEFEPTEYVRKVFSVKAEEVTYENINAVAQWCKGTVAFEVSRILGAGEVKLPVVKFAGQGEDKGKELVARLGSFVVQVQPKGRFRVYRATQFHAAFEQKFVTSVSSDHTDITGEPCKPCSTLIEEDDNSSVDGQETAHVSL